MQHIDIYRIFRILYEAHGPRRWWPAETPFEVMVGAILVQNTAWSNVEKAIANLRDNRCLDAERLATMPPERLAQWIRPSGYFNIKSRRLQNYCRWYLGQGGVDKLAQLETAELRRALLAVNGVGPETADDILLYAFQRPVFVIDAYTRRLFGRLGLIPERDDYESWRALFENWLNRHTDRTRLFNEYHALIVHHAKTSCCKRPICGECCLQSLCSTGSGR